MASIKEATHSAIQFAVDTLGENRTVDLRLEEIDSINISGNEYWQITLSMVEANSLNKVLLEFQGNLSSGGKREYKLFNVSKETGEVSTMKIREFASV